MVFFICRFCAHATAFVCVLCTCVCTVCFWFTSLHALCCCACTHRHVISTERGGCFPRVPYVSVLRHPFHVEYRYVLATCARTCHRPRGTATSTSQLHSVHLIVLFEALLIKIVLMLHLSWCSTMPLMDHCQDRQGSPRCSCLEFAGNCPLLVAVHTSLRMSPGAACRDHQIFMGRTCWPRQS